MFFDSLSTFLFSRGVDYNVLRQEEFDYKVLRDEVLSLFTHFSGNH